MAVTLGPMTVGEILDRALKILLRRFGAFLFITLIFMGPVQVYAFWWQTAMANDPQNMGLNLGGMLVLLGLQLIVVPMATGSAVVLVAREYLDDPASINEALMAVLRRFFPLLFALMSAGVLTMVGCIACCVPGVIAMALFAVVAPAVVLENTGAFAALQRSVELTKDHWLRAIAIVAMTAALNFIVLAVFAAWQVVTSGAFSSGDLNQALRTLSQPRPPDVLPFVAQFLALSIVAMFFNAVWPLFYFDLRIRKEGFDLTFLSGGDKPADPA